MKTEVRLIVPIKGKPSAWVHRRCVLPFPPFIGLSIGAQTVVSVEVCQGDDDSEIEVRCTPTTAKIAAVWCNLGNWQLEEVE